MGSVGEGAVPQPRMNPGGGDWPHKFRENSGPPRPEEENDDEEKEEDAADDVGGVCKGS